MAKLSVQAQFNDLIQNVKAAKLNVYLNEALVCESLVDITVLGGHNSGILNVCSFDVEKPQLWWPIGFGKQNLYKVKVVYQAQTVVKNVGLRKVELVQDPIIPEYKNLHQS